MKRRFAALRFFEDENLSDRLYWYLCELPAKEGDKVLAPVGMHDRLQAGAVEKLIEAEEKDAPYDLRLIKRVEAFLGARKLDADGTVCTEFGGQKYDRKRYTRFSVALYAENVPQRTDTLEEYGVTEILGREEESLAELCEKLSRARGCALLTGRTGAALFAGLLDLARGDAEPLLSGGAERETVRRLQEKIL